MPAVDVPGADDHRELRPGFLDGDDLLGDRGDGLRVDPVLAPTEQRLAGELQERPPELRSALGRDGFRDLVRAGRHEPVTETRDEPRDRRAGLAQRLADRLRGLVDPRLLEESTARHRREEALVQHAVHDLLTRRLGLRLHLFGVGVDRALGVQHLGRDVLTLRPLGRREGDVHRELARELLGAAFELDEHADLVRRRMRVAGEHVALPAPRSAPGRRCTMFSPSFAMSSMRSSSKLSTTSGPSAWTARSTLTANSWNSSFFDDGLGLAADADDRADVAVDDVADHALGRLAAGALARGRHAALAQERAGSVEIAVRLLERALAVHHPRAGGVAELLDERCADRGAHSGSPPSAATAAGSSSAPAAASAGLSSVARLRLRRALPSPRS